MELTGTWSLVCGFVLEHVCLHDEVMTFEAQTTQVLSQPVYVGLMDFDSAPELHKNNPNTKQITHNG